MYTLHIDYDESHYKAFIKYHSVGKQRIIGLIGFFVMLFVLYWMSNNWFSNLFGSDFSPIWLMGFGGLVYIVGIIWMMKRLNHITLMNNLNNEIRDLKIVFDEDTFETSASLKGNPIYQRIDYALIRYMVLKPDLILLYTNSNQAIIIPKSAIASEMESELMVFLKERINVRV
ncbi:YcxB family protein [Acholeplasma vituli]|uniref:YcxB family protein n=1 Tax=Paracholeplasma vituli TaxID=69473 RepID=A0ABT2Q0M1_9MOLU|nr:YcxB family protein [Paracholeplasma vituli]MCU0105458.1 YcxB family protein [Paracholeplasma vituli]